MCCLTSGVGQQSNVGHQKGASVDVMCPLARNLLRTQSSDCLLLLSYRGVEP